MKQPCHCGGVMPKGHWFQLPQLFNQFRCKHQRVHVGQRSLPLSDCHGTHFVGGIDQGTRPQLCRDCRGLQWCWQKLFDKNQSRNCNQRLLQQAQLIVSHDTEEGHVIMSKQLATKIGLAILMTWWSLTCLLYWKALCFSIWNNASYAIFCFVSQITYFPRSQTKQAY